MTRPTGEDEMSEHLLHLQRMANESWIGSPERAALDAALAALSAPAEAQPVAWQFQDREGKWHGFMDERHRQNTIADGSWPVRALYAAPPSAPVGVEGFDKRFAEMLLDILNDVQDELGFTDEDKACQNGSIEIVAAINELREDAERYRWLRDSKACSMSVSFNDHHNVYQSVQQAVEHSEGYYDGMPEGELRRMIETDTIWTVHVYPRNPVGFDDFHGATLDAAIDQARRKGVAK